MRQRSNDPAPLLTNGERGLIGVEGRPRAPRLAAADKSAQEVGATLVEVPKNIRERVSQGAEAVARIERRSLADEPLELEVGEDGLQHQRADVELRGELVLGDGERRAYLVFEHGVQ